MEEKTITMDGASIPVKHEEFVDCNILSATVGTTGWQKEGSKWACRTYLELKDEACTNMRAKVEEEDGKAKRVLLYFEGQTELHTFIRALTFALDTLVDQSSIPGVGEPFEIDPEDFTV